jgi:PAS domain S-box-containing protein
MMKNMKVLVVDDNREGRLLLSKILTSSNYEVKDACNGIEALESLKTSKPDLIISDILMPEMDGFTLIRELKKDIICGKIPVVLYSAQYVNEKDKELAEKLGASGFITKPAEPKDIIEKIKSVLAESGSAETKNMKSHISKDEEYMGEYAERVFMKLEDKVKELEDEITERKQVETKLKESMESYRSLFNNSPISLWEEDFSEVKKHIDSLRNKGIKDFRIYFQEHPEEVANCLTMSKVIDVNRATLQLYEAGSKEELLAGLGKVFGEESYKVFREALIALTQDKVLFESEAINYTLSGRKMHIIIKWSLKPGYEQICSKVLVSILDITQRKIAEESLKSSEKKYRDLFENANDAICIVDANLKYLDANIKFMELSGYSKEEILKMGIFDIIPPEQFPRSNEEFKKLHKKGHYEKFIGKIVTKSGNLIDVEVNSSAIIEDGRIIGSRDILRDITERKKAEDLLQESKAQLQSILDNSNTVVFLKDLKGRYITVNRRYEELFHVTRQTVVGKSDYDIFPREHADKFRQNDSLAMEKGSPLEIEESVPHDDGPHVYISVKFPLFTAEEKPYAICGIATDITGRKIAEENIEKSLKEKEILLREIHHRVKNNMQIISSLLGLASETIKDKKYVDMFRESQNRINSMSLIHEKLYRSRDLAKIDLKEYVKDLANAIFQSRGVIPGTIVFKLNIGNVQLGIDQSIPLGLIINELITNSLKYAFLGDRKGEINVSLHPIDENTFELIVGDNGVGIPCDVDFRKTESLGLRLVTILVENQLKGKIDLDRSKGTEFNITFKGRQ